MDEYSRILIEKYCREHPRSKKTRILRQLIEMSYDFPCERDPELREALEELDEFLFRW